MLHLKYVVRFKPLINWTCLHNANQCQYLRHLEEIDCSVAIVGRPAAIYKILGFMGGQINALALHTVPKFVL